MPAVVGTPEEISAMIYGGSGPLSINRAGREWQNMYHKMFEKYEEFGKEIDDLSEAWSGWSASRMAERVEPFQDWLMKTLGVILQTHTAAVGLEDACRCARSKTVEPKVIANNRAMVRQLSQPSALGLNGGQIARLEEQYDKYAIQNAEAMREYREQVYLTLSNLPSWRPPPRIVSVARWTDRPTRYNEPATPPRSGVRRQTDPQLQPGKAVAEPIAPAKDTTAQLTPETPKRTILQRIFKKS